MTGQCTEQWAHWVREKPDSPVFTFFGPEGPLQTITWRQFHGDILHCRDWLRSQGLTVGDLVAIVMELRYDLIVSFCGAISAGLVPTILPSISEARGAADEARSLRHIVDRSQISALITTNGIQSGLLQYFADSSCGILGEPGMSSCLDPHDEAASFLSDDDDRAFMQFSSGSTGSPKGIVITHSALNQYLRVTEDILAITPDDVVVSWLPLYHDMGLISGVLQPLFSGQHSILIDPGHWLRQPELLFFALDRFRGSICWMPNFAFRYCVRALPSDGVGRYDLSSLRIVGCGSEPVQRDDLEAFATNFKDCGLRREALTIGYGLAEHIAGITVTPPDRFPDCDWIDTAGMENNEAIATEPTAPGARAILSCGFPKSTVELDIVNERGEHLSERQIGEILVRSPSLFAGYWQEGRIESAISSDGWFCSGDIGYIAEGQLYVCGRKKDLIIVGGRNVLPAILERIAERVLGEQCRFAIAFGLYSTSLGTESPIIVCEMRAIPDAAESEAHRQLICRLVYQKTQVWPTDVVFVEKGWILKTTSGKFRRAETCAKYQAMIASESETRAVEDLQHMSSDSSRTETEQRILTLFRTSLKRDSLGIHDSFFEWGGDSLSAIEILMKIEQIFHRRLPASSLIESQTVAKLASLLDHHHETVADSPLTALRAITSESRFPVLFLVHGLTGGILRYEPLVRALGDDYPVFGLQCVDQDNSGTSVQTIEMMAARYVKAIQSLQPHGPYYLGGYCFGGIVAFEMARQLSALAERVNLVAMFEGFAPPMIHDRQSLRSQRRYLIHFIRGFPQWIRDFTSSGRAKKWHYWEQALKLLGRKSLNLVGIQRQFFEEEDVSFLPEPFRHLYVRNMRALQVYNPGMEHIEARLVLFRSSQTLAYAPSHDRGWNRYGSSPMDIHVIGGTHHTILTRPFVDELARTLAPYLGS